jgi:hypothetical protein
VRRFRDLGRERRERKQQQVQRQQLARLEAEWQRFKREVNVQFGYDPEENRDLGRFRNPDGSFMFPDKHE